MFEFFPRVLNPWVAQCFDLIFKLDVLYTRCGFRIVDPVGAKEKTTDSQIKLATGSLDAFGTLI